jgi:O-antigen/teichoic acid export membrane protein
MKAVALPRPESVMAFGQVWRGVFTRGIATVLAKGAAFLATIILVRRLPAGEAGTFLLALAAASTLGPLVSMGMAESAARLVPRLDVGGSEADGNGVIRSSLRVVASVAVAALVASVAVALMVAPSAAAWAAAVGGLATMLALDAVGAAFLRARRHAFLAEMMQALGPVVFLGALMISTQNARPTSGDAFLMRAAIELVATVALLVAVMRMTHHRPAAHGRWSLLGSAMPFWIAGIVWLALQNVDVLILGLTRGANEVAGYVPILRTADLSAAIQGLFAVYVLPAAAALHASRSLDEVQAVYVRATAMALVVSAPLLTMLAVGPGEVVHVLLGARSAEGETVARILALAYAINAVFCLGGVILQAIGDVWRLAVRWAIVLGLTVVVDAILVPWLGARGAAVGTLVALIALNASSAQLLWAAHGITPFHAPLIVPLITGLVVAATASLLGLGDDGPLSLVLVGIASGAAVGGATWAASRSPHRSTIPIRAGTRRGPR